MDLRILRCALSPQNVDRVTSSNPDVVASKLDHAQTSLTEALKKRTQKEKFEGRVPTIARYADDGVTGLRVQNSTMQGYRKLIRNHISPALGNLPLEKITASTVAVLLLDLGEHPMVVLERLGPSAITTTMNIYSHVIPTTQREAVSRFAVHLDYA